ncbi:hypothetical protein JCM2811A_26950 [Methylorubrum rhodinum]
MQVEQFKGYRPALVAGRPGWLEKAHYVYGNGEVERPDGDDREVIIAFKPNAKFKPVGSLAGWQASIGQAIADQPIPLFIVRYAFVGPLLRLAPAHVQNPQVEIVGKGEIAKTTILTVAASAHAGDPTSDVGGAETWDMTINAHDPQKREHADSLLALDEVNLAGLDGRDQRDLLLKAGFKGATNGSRKRLTDTVVAPNVRVATLSTSNVPRRDLVKGDKTVLDALNSRIVTISIPEDHKLGVFQFVPRDFADAQAAAEHLRMAVNEHYGVAGRVFMRRLVAETARDEDQLRRKIEALMQRFYDAAHDEVPAKGMARGKKVLALTFVAGTLAQEWGVIPKSWGALLPATLAIYRSLVGASAAPVAPSAVDLVRAYRKRNRGNIVRASRLKKPLTKGEFLQKAGVLRCSGKQMDLIVSAQRFQQEFPNYRAILNQLRDEGRAQTEGGQQPKLTIKAPGRICRDAPRVYCITVVDDVVDAHQRALRRFGSCKS